MAGAPMQPKCVNKLGGFQGSGSEQAGAVLGLLTSRASGPAMIELPLPAYAGHISPAQLSIDQADDDVPHVRTSLSDRPPD
jgi:hypothetical protein